MTRQPDSPRRIVLLPNRALTEAIDVAAARLRLSAPAMILHTLAKVGPVADELPAVRERQASAQGAHKVEAAA